MKFSEYRSLIFLTLASFFAGLSIGYIKFFLLGHLADHEHLPSDKTWIIQAVGALITLGPCLTFVIGGPFASAYRKSNIMCISACVISLIMAFGAATFWLGSAWTYVFLAGMGLGLFNAARNSAIPIEAHRENISTEVVNAWVNNLYLVGLLLGVPLGTRFHLDFPMFGGWFTCILFVLCSIFGFASRISDEQKHLNGFKESFVKLLSDCRSLFSEFNFYLSISPLLWGIAGALSLAATAYVEECHFSGPIAASLISIYAAFGVVSGNFVSTKLQHKRYRASFISSLVLGIAITLIPVFGYFHETVNQVPHLGYILLSILLMICGFSFGCATNLIEAEYLTNIYTKRLEGTGAALLSAMTSLWTFILGGLTAVAVLNGILSSSTQFFVLTLITGFVCLLIVRLRGIKKS